MIQCMSGAEALERLNETEIIPDIVLLDMMMPEQGGIDVCKQLRTKCPCYFLSMLMVGLAQPPLPSPSLIPLAAGEREVQRP